jgi:hypothetical protein
MNVNIIADVRHNSSKIVLVVQEIRNCVMARMSVEHKA